MPTTAGIPTGPPGNSLLGGVGVPPGSLGVDGDYYIDFTNSGAYYGPKTNGSWGRSLALSLPAAAAGGDLGGTYPNPTVVATHLSAPLPLAQGGTGSATQNFVDLTTSQTVGGTKTFTSTPVGPAIDPAFGNQLTRFGFVTKENGWSYADYTGAGVGLKAWTGNPGYSSGSAALTFGAVQLNKVWVRDAATVANLSIVVTTAGVGLTTGQNFAAIYDASGNQVAITADQTTAWGTTGAKTMALTSSLSASSAGYYVALLSNGATTAPSIAVHSNGAAAALNFGLSTGSSRALVTGAGNTAMPSTITLGSQTAAGMDFMAFLT